MFRSGAAPTDNLSILPSIRFNRCMLSAYRFSENLSFFGFLYKNTPGRCVYQCRERCLLSFEKSARKNPDRSIIITIVAKAVFLHVTFASLTP